MHGLHGAVTEHGILIENRGNVHQAARPEENLHCRKIGVAAGAKYVYQTILFHVVGNDARGLKNALFFMCVNIVNDADNFFVISVHYGSLLHDASILSEMTRFIGFRSFRIIRADLRG